jgi:hypothetical protein
LMGAASDKNKWYSFSQGVAEHKLHLNTLEFESKL